MKKLLLAAMLLTLTLVLLACGGATTQSDPEVITVVETQVVEVTSIVEGQTVIETQVVEREVIVTATPDPEAMTDMGDDRVTLDVTFASEPPSLDPSLATDTTSVWTIRQMFEGLTTFDEEANVVPNLATDWEVSDDGLTYTFNLRDDVSWVTVDPSGEVVALTDGDGNSRMVTAGDVEYAIKRTLAPETASDYAYVLYIIQGAEEYNTADDSAEDYDGEALMGGVGVTAVDDTTLEITITDPVAYFPSIAGLWMTYPQPQEVIEQYGEQWTEAGIIATNGPYTLEEWKHNASMRLVKNPLWYNADEVQIEVIQGPIIQEASTAMSLYEAGEIDLMADPGSGPPLPDMDRIMADSVLSTELVIAERLCTYYYGFVTDKAPVDDPLVRRALSAAIDRTSLVENVLKGGQIPAHSFAPPGVFGNVAENMDIGSFMVMDDYAAQVAQAQQWMEEAGYANGAGLDLTLMHNTSEAHAQIAQVVQQMWAEAFPEANVTIENQEWGVYLTTIDPDTNVEEKPHVYRLGWCADYPDSNNWLNEVFNSKSGQNSAVYSNPEYDSIVEQAAVEQDPAEREALYAQAEELLVDTDAAIAPIYYYTSVRMYKPWLSNTVRSPVSGDPIWQWKLDAAAKAAALGN